VAGSDRLSAARPRLLDLYCGGGGAAVGYHRAGFDVVGVDVAPQPHYPFTFHQADALSFLEDVSAGDYAAVHASPPCERYSTATLNFLHHPDLYVPTRDALEALGLPWVIENVVGAPYRSGVILCGSMFGLDVRRHRNFETSFPLLAPADCSCHGTQPWQVTGHLHHVPQLAKRHRKPDRTMAPVLMCTPWMSWEECVLAIPPAYTLHVGRALHRWCSL